jgi:uncharacterized phage-associated protein
MCTDFVLSIFALKGGDIIMTIFELANAFLSMGPQSPKKLQKLCYYAYAWYLAYNDEELFENHFEAWVHGPVDPNLYKEYRSKGYSEWNSIPQYVGLVDPDAKSIAEWVYNAYGNFSATDLEALTHKELPWIDARQGIDPWERSNAPILSENIKKFYREQAKSQR